MRRPSLVALLIALCIPLHPSLAQGWMEIEGRRPGTPVGPVARVGSRVTIAVDDRLARVQVEERFRNGGPAVAEGSYFYPLAGEASFTDFSLWLNDEELRGEPFGRGVPGTTVEQQRERTVRAGEYAEADALLYGGRP